MEEFTKDDLDYLNNPFNLLDLFYIKMTKQEQIEELQEENQALKESIKAYQKMLFDKRNILERDRLEIERISKEEGVGVCEVMNGSRVREVVKAKQRIALYFRNKNYTYSRIAKILNVEAHGTIMYLCNKKEILY